MGVGSEMGGRVEGVVKLWEGMSGGWEEFGDHGERVVPELSRS